MAIRAKFRVQSVQNLEGMGVGGHTEKYAELVKLYAVYSEDPNSENAHFWKATPAGSIEMQISNPGAWEIFSVGTEFYVDLTRCDA